MPRGRGKKRKGSDDVYEVEAILEELPGNGKRLFRVKWKGDDEITIEPEENLTNCDDLLRRFTAQQAAPSEETKDDSEEEAYEVESILAVRFRMNAVQYRVKWKCYNEMSWEPEDNLEGCSDVLDVFHRDHAEDMARIRANKEPQKRYVTEISEQKTESDNEDQSSVFSFGDAPYESDQELSDVTEAPVAVVSTGIPKQGRPRQLFSRKHASKFEVLDSDGDDSGILDEEVDQTLIIEDHGEVDDDDVGVMEEIDEIHAIAGPQLGINEDMLKRLALDGWQKIKLTGKAKTSDKDWTSRDRTDPNDALKLGTATNLFVSEGATLTLGAVAAASSKKPIDVFFFFLSRDFWRDVERETNKYEYQTRSKRRQEAIQPSRQSRSGLSPMASPQETTSRLLASLDAFKPIRAAEITRFIALLISRAIAPLNGRMSDHWKTVPRGAIAPGTWSRFMPKARFNEINRFLHFNDNLDPRAKQDRAWKIRRVLDELQRTFKVGMKMGRWLAYDEMVIPSRSSRNTIRVYLKNKPHKYGTKLFAICCGKTHYCKRIEVYCGKKQNAQFVDTAGGPASVIRNIRAVWPRREVDPSKRRIVVTDREYTSIPLAMRLLDMGYYSVGTIMPSRRGFPNFMKFRWKQSSPKNVSRGHYKVAERKGTNVDKMRLTAWVDSKPVYFLSTGLSAQKTHVKRKMKNGDRVDVQCPQLVQDYNTYMSGVDSHDQLRLQRYSIQRHLRCQKYYKNLFYGLLDMALVNAYIVHKAHETSIGDQPLTHCEFLAQLHQELLLLTDEDFEVSTPTSEVVSVASDASRTTDQVQSAFQIARTTHAAVQSTDTGASGAYKFRVCKVCSIIARAQGSDSPGRVMTTRFYCRDCSSDKGKVFLCNIVRWSDGGNSVSCFNIWHAMWKNGREIPGTSIRIRRTTEERVVEEPAHLRSPSDTSFVTLLSGDTLHTSQSHDFA